MRLKGKKKLADDWSSKQYTIVKRISDEMPPYTVKPVNGDSPERTLHRNLLLPCSLPHEDENSTPIPPKPTPRPRQSKRLASPPSHSPTNHLHISGDDSEFRCDVNPDDIVITTLPVPAPHTLSDVRPSSLNLSQPKCRRIHPNNAYLFSCCSYKERARDPNTIFIKITTIV